MKYVCSQCGEPIPLEDFESGRAVYAEGISYCAKCVTAVLPMLKALQQREEEEQVQTHRTHRTGPPRPAIDYFAGHAHAEHKSSNTGVVVLGVGAALLLVVGLAFALSGNGGPAASSGRNAPRSDRVAPPPPVNGGVTYDRQEPVLRESFTTAEIEQIEKMYADVLAEVDSQPAEFKKNIERLEEFKRAHRMPQSWVSKVSRRIDKVYAAWEKKANAELDKYLERAKELEEDWKLVAALAYLQSFPKRFAGIGNVPSRLEEEKENVRKLVKTIETYRETIEKAKILRDKCSLKELLALLDEECSGKKAPSDLVKQVAELRENALKEVKRRKALEDQRIAQQHLEEEEAKRERERKYAEMRESKPLHFADWTSALPRVTAQVEQKGAEHKKHGGEYRLVFPENKQGTVTLTLALGMKPEMALLTIVGTDAALAQVAAQVNGNPVPIQVIEQEAPAAKKLLEFDLDNALNNGENLIRIDIAPAGKPLPLAAVQLRVYLPEEQIKKERVRAKATMRRLLAQAKREERERRRKANGQRKKVAAQPWPPKVEVGKTVSLFNGKNLSGWKPVGKGNWAVKNGVIVCVNSSGRPARLLTDLPGQNTWRDYEVELEVILVRGELFIGVHGSVDNSGAIAGAELGPSLEKNKLSRVKVRIAGTKMFTKIDDKAEVMANGNSTFPVGGPYIVAEPNSEIRVKSIKFTLRSK